MAMSNLEPRPARLHPGELSASGEACRSIYNILMPDADVVVDHWDQPYTVPEAVAGFKRAAATHGWEYVYVLFQVLMPPTMNQRD